METILQEIRDERKRQDDKWGSQRHLPPYTWMTILMEEVGEAAQAALERDDNYAVELVQVAAVAVAALESYRSQAIVEDTSPDSRGYGTGEFGGEEALKYVQERAAD